MSEKKKAIPKPTLTNTTPTAPPVTTVDADAPPAGSTPKPTPTPSPSPTPPPSQSQSPATPATPEKSAPPAAGDAPESPEATSTETPDQKGQAVETDMVKRFLGVLIDGIIASVLAAIVSTIADSGLLHWLVFAAAMLTRDSLPALDGQSIGKKIMNTKAVKDDGSSLSGDWTTGATRNILLALPILALVECVIILTRSGKPGDGKRLGDDWAKTRVISCE